MNAMTTQALRQPKFVINKNIIGGNNAWLMTDPREVIAITRPRWRINHKAISVVGIKVNEPCPNRRIAIKPRYSSMGLDTVLIQTAANPNRRPTSTSIIRAPNRSKSFPTNIIAVEAVREPSVYKPDTVDLDQPVSSMMGSTKTEKLYVCPGPDMNMERLATGRIIQP